MIQRYLKVSAFCVAYLFLQLFQGSNKSLKPYMLAAHIDVVPVETQVWDYPQFKAHTEDGFIYGRGTIDDKHGLMVRIFSSSVVHATRVN